MIHYMVRLVVFNGILTLLQQYQKTVAACIDIVVLSVHRRCADGGRDGYR